MKKRGLLFLIAGIIIITSSYILGWSTFFTVSSIEIKGTQTYLPAGIVKGEKLARVEPRIIERRFGKYDWIKSAHVSRNWLTGKVSITIIERTPIAIYNNLAIDAQGKSFNIRANNLSRLPKIQAPTVDSAILAAAFYGQLPADIATQVTLVKLHSGDTYVVELTTGTGNLELRWGRSEENALKAKVYRALLLQPENKNIKRIDVSAPHAPIVK